MKEAFSLRFFGGFASQRRAFLDAPEFAPLPLPKLLEDLLRATGTFEAPEPPATRVGLWRGCLQAVRPFLIRSAFWNTFIAISVLLSLWAVRHILDESQSLLTASLLCFFIFAADIAKNIIQYFDALWRAQIARGLQLHLCSLVNRKLAVLDPLQASEFSSGNLKTLISGDVESVEDFITAASANWIPTLVMLIVLTPAIYYTSGILGIFGVLIALIQLPLAIVFARWMEHYQSKSRKHQDKLSTLIGEWVRNIRLVRYLGWQQPFERDIADSVRKLTIESGLRHIMVCITYGISFSWWLMPIVGMVLIAYYNGWPIVTASLFASIWALSHLVNHIQHLPYAISMYATASAGAARINKLLDAPELRRHLKPVAEKRALGTPIRVILHDVTISLADNELISHVSTEIDLTSRNAIVGSVGAGKSIFLDLITGEKFPTGGKIEIEFSSGVKDDLRCEDVYQHYRTFLGIVPQIPYLSNALFSHNISLDESAALQTIEAASRLAELHVDVASFPRGYSEEIGETGINLSGGQKQRVSLARAFFSQRPVFVLDDPLSAVDRRTEQRLFQAIMDQAKGFILVSHRLDELSRCERIMVIEKGRIIEDGPPEQLMSREDSAFNKFLRAQEQSEEEHE